jgi:hypothetical protein
VDAGRCRDAIARVDAGRCRGAITRVDAGRCRDAIGGAWTRADAVARSAAR